ncbi:MAG: fatty acid desaturase family protein [Vitreoscilla sp.]|nr:fatty acid desaturase family protein [Vitreoscilla sp.]
MRNQDIPILSKRFFALDNVHGPTQWAVDAILICMSIAMVQCWVTLYPIALVIIAARQRALADLLHQASHLALARSRGLNRFLGTWCSGYLVFQTWKAYIESHVAKHHGRFGKLEDPDLDFMREIGLYGPFDLLSLWRGLKRYWHYLVVNRLTVRDNRAEALRLIALWTAIVIVAGPMNVLAFWIVPMLLAYAPIGYLIEIAEHWPLMEAGHPLYQTRNRSSSWLEGWLFSTHDENYHLLHHLYPRLPNKSFKAVHAHLSGTWPEYRAWCAANGGVLFSGNGTPSVVQLLLRSAAAMHERTPIK